MANFKGHPDVKINMTKLAEQLIGKTVADVRYQTDEEMEDAGFYHRAPIIVLSDGSLISGQQDDEGNDAGPLSVQTPQDANIFCVCD